jgi:hypothetical protein
VIEDAVLADEIRKLKTLGNSEIIWLKNFTRIFVAGLFTRDELRTAINSHMK